MPSAIRSYKGYGICCVMPETPCSGSVFGHVQILPPGANVFASFTPDWPATPRTAAQAEAWLLAYAAGVIDCDLAGGLGPSLRRE